MSSVNVEPGAPINTLAIAQIVLSSIASTCNPTILPKAHKKINQQILNLGVGHLYLLIIQHQHCSSYKSLISLLKEILFDPIPMDLALVLGSNFNFHFLTFLNFEHCVYLNDFESFCSYMRVTSFKCSLHYNVGPFCPPIKNKCRTLLTLPIHRLETFNNISIPTCF